MAVVGSERRRITQHYIQVNVAPDGGGSLLCAQDGGPSSDVLVIEPSATGCAHFLGRLMARRTVSS